jgi:hypothetical protein
METGGNPGGFLALTYSINSQNKWVVFPDIDDGKTVTAFTFDADLRIGNPQSDRAADGFSISFARAADPLLANPSDVNQFAATLPEAGTTTGIAIGFDTWSGNALPDGADIEGIIIRVDNVTVKKYEMPTRNGAAEDPTSMQTGPRDAAYWADPGYAADNAAWAMSPAAWAGLKWEHLSVVLDNAAKLTVKWKGTTILDTYQTKFFPSPGRIVLACRTGGANENTHMDNITLVTTALDVDTEAPTAPTNLRTAAEVGTARVALTWEPATDNSGRVAYEIEKDGTVLTTVITDTNYVDRAVLAKTSHTYKVRAYDVTGNKSAYSAPLTITTPDEVTAVGVVKGEFFDGIEGTGVDLLLGAATFQANTPSRVAYFAGLTTGGENGNAGFNDTWGNNYGMRITGTLTPAETASYDFFIRSDDSSQFYLNETGASIPDVTTASATIAETGCCHAFLEPTDTTVTPVSMTTASPIALTAGKAYGFVVLLKEGGGGDGVAVAWRKVGDTTAAANLPAISGAVLGGSKQDAVGASVTFTTSPKDATVFANEKVSFTAAAKATSHYSSSLVYQWYKNGNVIPGATAATYTIPVVPVSDNGAKIKVLGIAVGAQVYSSEATLTVNADTKLPSMLYVHGEETLTKLTVGFSEPVKAPSATTAANYKLDNGATVTSATLADQFTVQLTTSKLNATTLYTLTVNNVQDNAANAIAADSKFVFESWGLKPGVAKMEQWNGITGTTIDLLYNSEKWASAAAPDAVRYVAGMTSGGENGNGGFNETYGDNYGATVKAYLIPSVSGSYDFFIRSDDSSELYLSQNETFPVPVTDTPIAAETGCCKTFLEPGNTTEASVTTATPISLVAGTKYAILAVLKEGGGGDGVSVAWRKVGDTNSAPNLPDLVANAYWYAGPKATNVLSTNDVIVASSTNSPSSGGENAKFVLDSNSGTKYLNFDKLNTGFTVTPKSGATVITGISLTTANDSPNRDPLTYKVEGSLDGTTFATITEGSMPAVTNRFYLRTYTFANVMPYSIYRVTFPTVADAATANSMQIADVALLGAGFGGAIAAPATKPEVSIAKDATGKVVLTFKGTLQSSDTVSGPFTDVSGASPLTVTPAGGKFYRARN